MCIRDSLKAVADSAARLQEDAGIAKLPELLKRKADILEFSSLFVIGNEGKLVSSSQSRSLNEQEEKRPVSYTHLDVYTRQAGGCRLAVELKALTLYDVVTAVDEEPMITPCMSQSCSRNTGGDACRVHAELRKVQKVLVDALKSTTLYDLF